jgi:hypothetical protein
MDGITLWHALHGFGLWMPWSPCFELCKTCVDMSDQTFDLHKLVVMKLKHYPESESEW